MGYFKTAPGFLKMFEQLGNIAVCSLVLVWHQTDFFVETRISRALLASSIIGFILTTIVIITRIVKLEKEASMLLVDSGVGLCMAVFNIVIGGVGLDESIAINKNLELVSTKLNIYPELYIIAASVAVVVSVVYILDANFSLRRLMEKK